MTIIVPETIDHLDFEFTPPCEAFGCPPEQAVYKVIFNCCAHQMLVCEECYTRSINWLNGGGTFYCEFCDARDITDPYALVEKI